MWWCGIFLQIKLQGLYFAIFEMYIKNSNLVHESLQNNKILLMHWPYYITQGRRILEHWYSSNKYAFGYIFHPINWTCTFSVWYIISQNNIMHSVTLFCFYFYNHPRIHILDSHEEVGLYRSIRTEDHFFPRGASREIGLARREENCSTRPAREYGYALCTLESTWAVCLLRPGYGWKLWLILRSSSPRTVVRLCVTTWTTKANPLHSYTWSDGWEVQITVEAHR